MVDLPRARTQTSARTSSSRTSRVSARRRGAVFPNLYSVTLPLREAGACSGAENAEAERDCVEANAVATGVAVLPAQSAFLVKEQQVVLDFGGGDQVGAARVLPRESGVQARACPGSLARVESVVRRRAGRPRASAQTCAWPKPVPKCAFGRGGILSGFGAPGPGRVDSSKMVSGNFRRGSMI